MASSGAPPAAAAEVKEAEQKITPWEAEGAEGKAIDYNKLIEQFGSQKIDAALLERVERVTRRPLHPWLKRGFFFSHRDLPDILDAHEKGGKFYLYTGRGPSSDALHLGHLIPFVFTKYLQDAFNVPLVVQMTDDEKFLWKDVTLDEVHKYTRENAKDIIALGFDVRRTFLFQDTAYIGSLYRNVVRIQKAVTANQAKGIFGFTDSHNIGQFSFAAIQAAPSFPSSFPHIFPAGSDQAVRCLIPCAIDQDPYFRMTRDVAPRLGFLKPALIHSKFFPALQGYNTKMSASNENSAISLTDTPEVIRKKIMTHAFSGGRATVEEHRRLGADLSVDVPMEYLNFFMDDEQRLAKIREAYGKGEMLTGEVKAILADVLTERVTQHQRARAMVSEDVVDAFLAVRKTEY